MTSAYLASAGERHPQVAVRVALRAVWAARQPGRHLIHQPAARQLAGRIVVERKHAAGGRVGEVHRAAVGAEANGVAAADAVVQDLGQRAVGAQPVQAADFLAILPAGMKKSKRKNAFEQNASMRGCGVEGKCACFSLSRAGGNAEDSGRVAGGTGTVDYASLSP